MKTLIQFAEDYIRKMPNQLSNTIFSPQSIVRNFAMEASRDGYDEVELNDRAIVTYIVHPIDLDVRCEGLMYGASGFAEAMRNIVYYLNKNKVLVTASPNDKPDADEIDIVDTKKGKIIEQLSKIYYANNFPKVRIVMTIPMGVHRIPGSYMIAYIMFETQEFPEKYIRHLERNADEIWVPSQFNVDNIKKAGWKKPIFRMPLGVDTERFNPALIKPFSALESPIGLFNDQFIFLSIMGWSERKGITPLIEAYVKEFKPDDNTILYIKGGWYDQAKALEEVKNIVRRVKGDINLAPKIFLDFRIYSDKDHPRLYKSANVFVLPSRGEGWGLNYTEAMSIGLPTIGTACTSMIDFMNERNSYPVKVKNYRIESNCDWIIPDYKGAKFANPDTKDLRRKMRQVYEDDDIINLKGAIARQNMIEKWDWNHACKNWIKRLKDIEILLSKKEGEIIEY